jgi:S1/P1 Nuclease
MKRVFGLAVILPVALVLLSWGRTGHSTIGRVAEAHLTRQVRNAVNVLLGGESLADVASWADDNRDRSTASWHFINVEPGLSYDDFSKQVSSKENVYTSLQNQESILANAKASSDERATALKYIVHFVGDIHQPMHVSRAEDKGGNTIQVQYDGRGTNLHSLWDTKMLEHAGLNDLQLAQQFDNATSVQIKKWQSDPQMTWAWESYQISTQLYSEIGQLKHSTIDDAYYQSHIVIVQQRIEKAGIRLAGLLNTILANATITPVTTSPLAVVAKQINVTDAANHYDELVTITAKVFGTKDFGSMVLVNLGAAYPDSPLTVVLRGDAKSLGSGLDGKTITVTGKVVKYKAKPEIVVTDRGQIKQ